MSQAFAISPRTVYDETGEKVATLWRQSVAVEDIRRECGFTSRGAVYYWVNKLGLSRRKRTAQVVSLQAATRAPKSLTPRDARILQLHREGKWDAEVATLMGRGVSVSEVRASLVRSGARQPA